jgi:hypothetical protein
MAKQPFFGLSMPFCRLPETLDSFGRRRAKGVAQSTAATGALG